MLIYTLNMSVLKNNSNNKSVCREFQKLVKSLRIIASALQFKDTRKSG